MTASSAYPLILLHSPHYLGYYPNWNLGTQLMLHPLICTSVVERVTPPSLRQAFTSHGSKTVPSTKSYTFLSTFSICPRNLLTTLLRNSAVVIINFNSHVLRSTVAAYSATIPSYQLSPLRQISTRSEPNMF